MPIAENPALVEVRARYATEMARAAGVVNARVEAAFAAVPRENFLTPPPWTVFPPGGYVMKTTEDPADLYEDVLVVLDAARGVNNGQPSLHAAWLATVDPKPGETAIQIGAGTGYYTAILAHLVSPGGAVDAYEVDEELAEMAKRNLAILGNVAVHARSAFGIALPDADVIYVNAGTPAPDPDWLEALRPGGRLIFPWQPAGPGGVTMLVKRLEKGFSAKPLMHVGFVECEGGPAKPLERPKGVSLEQTRSVWLSRVHAPDETATAVTDAVWFSRKPVTDGEGP